MALQWGDFGGQGLTLAVTRGFVCGQLGEVKTVHSHRPLPLDPNLAVEVLCRKEEPVSEPGPEDFVFPHLDTGKPTWWDSVLDRHIKPAAAWAGPGSVGWHAFRYGYRSWLKRTNAPMEIQTGTDAPANIQTTLDTYGKEIEVSDLHRQAHSKVVKMILAKERVCA